MRFNAAVFVLAGSALAVPAPVEHKLLKVNPAEATPAPPVLPLNDSADLTKDLDSLLEGRGVAIAELMRRLETSSLSNLTSTAGISLPDDIVDKADGLSDNVPDIAGIIVGIIMNIRNSTPLLKNTPLNGVVQLALPIIEGVLNSLSTKKLTGRDLDERSLDLITKLLSSILGIATGLLGGVTSSAGGDLLGGLTGGLTGGGGAGDLVGGLTGGLTGGGGAGDLLGGLTGGRAANGTKGLNSLVAGAISGGGLTNSDSALDPELVSSLTGAITKGSGLSAATVLAELPDVSSLGDLTDIGAITDTLTGLTGGLTGGNSSDVSTDSLGKVADVLDFALDTLSSIALVPASLLPDPTDAPFRALSAELDALKPVVDSFKDILNGGLDVTKASDLTKLYETLDKIYAGLTKLSDEIVPELLKPTADYGLAGLLSVIKTVLTVASGYIATATQAVKNAGGNPNGLTDSQGLINGN